MIVLQEDTHREFEDIPCSEDGLQVSEAEYWEKYYEHPDFSYEWNNGCLEELPVTDYTGFLMYKWFFKILDEFLTIFPMGKMVGLEFGFRLPLPDRVTIRKPDLGVVMNSNPAILYLTDRSYAGIYDLCVESLSDSTLKEIERDTIIKKAEYECIGVREYYILDGKGDETVFYSLNEQGEYEPIQPDREGVIRSGLLPGFQFRMSDLYEQPSLRTLTDDEIYVNFVFPFYQEEKQRRKAFQKALILEKQRADQEKERADRLAAKLKALGISDGLI